MATAASKAGWRSGVTPADMAMFSRLGIPADLLVQAQIERVTDQEARSKYGIVGHGDMSGIAFPYMDPMNGHRWTARVRRDNPEIEDGKAKNKYISSYGDRRHLFFPPGSAELLSDRDVPLILVEAEKSALALVAWAERMGRKILPIGMGGCWGWRGRIGKVENFKGERVDEVGALRDLLCASNGRKTYVLLDANVATNPKVQQARAALVRQLRKQGADVLVPELPAGEGVNGPDDYLALYGDEAMIRVVDGAETGVAILDDVAGFVRRFVFLSDTQAAVVSLWILHTHAIEAAESTPFLNINSAEKQCGKTRLLEVLELLVAKPWLTGRVSAAVLIRKTDAESPTLLLDESDVAFNGEKDYAEALRGILNSGHRRGGKASLCIGQGNKITYRDFRVFGAKAVAGIGKLPDTVQDRSFPIRLQRKKPGETVARFRRRLLEREADQLRDRIAAWAESRLGVLKEHQPEVPDALSDRQQDGAEPLLAIADAVGGEWPARARQALVEILAGADGEDQSIRVRLLSDIRLVFDEAGADKLSSQDVTDALVQIESSPWADFSHGKPLSKVSLARLLKPFGIFPKNIRVAAGVPKGYERESFMDAWGRYLPRTGSETSPSGSDPLQPLQSSIQAAEMQFSDPLQGLPIAALKTEESPVNTGVVADVAAQRPDAGQEDKDERIEVEI